MSRPSFFDSLSLKMYVFMTVGNQYSHTAKEKITNYHNYHSFRVSTRSEVIIEVLSLESTIGEQVCCTGNDGACDFFVCKENERYHVVGSWGISIDNN